MLEEWTIQLWSKLVLNISDIAILSTHFYTLDFLHLNLQIIRSQTRWLTCEAVETLENKYLVFTCFDIYSHDFHEGTQKHHEIGRSGYPTPSAMTRNVEYSTAI